MPTPRERLLLLFEAEHPDPATADALAAKEEAIRRTFGLEPGRYRALIESIRDSGSHANAA
ncbi:DUF3263 domain-containing protein [Leifsonia poae]|uniref:DUF3263 domain-containing protein n=1 Tax=Leifsonia poae TaxID=110933 RepID=UPI001CC04C2C|nr:DUF3263 domain-containing protein [Leifsonia poae]